MRNEFAYKENVEYQTENGTITVQELAFVVLSSELGVRTLNARTHVVKYWQEGSETWNQNVNPDAAVEPRWGDQWRL